MGKELGSCGQGHSPELGAQPQDPRSKLMARKKQFSTFVVDHLLFGVGVEKVQEVIRYQEMTRVPLAPSVVKGLINLRGQIVTAVDLRRRLGSAGTRRRPISL